MDWPSVTSLCRPWSFYGLQLGRPTPKKPAQGTFFSNSSSLRLIRLLRLSRVARCGMRRRRSRQSNDAYRVVFRPSVPGGFLRSVDVFLPRVKELMNWVRSLVFQVHGFRTNNLGCYVECLRYTTEWAKLD